MSEDTTPNEGEDDTTASAEADKKHEETVAYERFQKVNERAKESAQRAAAAEKDKAALAARLEALESAGLPEVDKMARRLEAAEKRAADAERQAQEQERRAVNLSKESWVTAAARELGFVDPEDALNPRYVNLDSIESKEDAERILKRVAKAKKHLIKDEDPARPQVGRVMTNGTAGDGKAPEVDPKLAQGQRLLDAFMGG